MNWRKKAGGAFARAGGRGFRGGVLRAEARAEIGELIGAAEEDVAARDELRVFLDEDLARRAEIEIAWLVAEELAVHARPHQAAIGVDVHLGHAELGGFGLDFERLKFGCESKTPLAFSAAGR